MRLQNLVEELLQEDENDQRRSRALIFVLGDQSRLHIENGLKAKPGRQSSVNAIVRSRRDMEVLFLNRLQYLFMYLMRWEAENVGYNQLILYGLDELIISNSQDSDKLTNPQLRLANLIFSAAFRIKRTHCLKDVTVIHLQDHLQLKRVEDYWRHVC